MNYSLCNKPGKFENYVLYFLDSLVVIVGGWKGSFEVEALQMLMVVGLQKSFVVYKLVVWNLVHSLEVDVHFHKLALDNNFHSLHLNYCDYTSLGFLVHLP